LSFRIFTIEQIILNPVTVAKHLFVLTVLKDSCVVIFAKTTARRNCTRHYSEIVTISA